MSNHDKAIDAAFRSRFGNDPDHADKVSGVIFDREQLRRAITAFLRAEATQLLAAYKARSIGGMLADELNSLAAELESDNA